MGAADALLFPVMLKHIAQIESLDPVSGDKIRVTVTPDGVQKVEPETAVVSWVNSVDPSNITGSVCHYVYFFSSSETASRWVVEHPGKMFYPVIDAFQAAKKSFITNTVKCKPRYLLLKFSESFTHRR
jgi:alkylmercury lyase